MPAVLLTVALLLFGFTLRVIDVGAEPLRWDEVNTDYLAFEFGHEGIREPLGVRTVANLRQSPFFHDVFAVSFAFDPDPRMARLFLAAIHLVSMALLYLLVRRYFSPQTALVTLLLYAVMPRAIWSGRYVWNPSLTLPFVIAYYLTGLLAGDGKRWARRLNSIMLCCAFQAHPVAALSGLLFPLFVIRDWKRASGVRRELVLDYGTGFLVSVVLLVPWVYASLRFGPKDTLQAVISESEGFAHFLQLLVNNPTLLVYRPNTPTLYIPISKAQSVAFALIGWFSILASLYALLGGILRRHVPSMVMGAAFILPSMATLALPRSFDHYFIPLLPATAIVQAITLVGARPRRRWLTAAGLAVLVAMSLIQAQYFFYWLQIYDHQATYNYDWQPPLRTVLQFQKAAIQPGRETIYYIFGQADGRPYDEYYRLWRILGARGPSRVISGDSYAFPVPKAGATIISFLPDQVIPPELTTRSRQLVLGNWLRAVELPPNAELTPTCAPAQPEQLANGATVVGYYVPATSDFRPGKIWNIYVLWRSTLNEDHTIYQMFVELVDGQGERIAQLDSPTLHTDLWHADEMLISQVPLTIPARLPDGDNFAVRVGMYRLPYTGPVAVLKDGKSADETWVTIPFCSAGVAPVF